MMLLLQYGGGKGPMHYINTGGPVIWPLCLLLFIGLVIAFTRLIVIQRSKINTSEFMQKVRSLLLEGNLDGAIELCRQLKRGVIPRIFEVALLRKAQKGGHEDLEKVVENKAIQEIAGLESGLWVLALIANVAPILGFLGTVVGMIQSFDVLAKQGMNNPAAVAEGISVALITTAGGLIVAVCVLPFYNWFTARIAGIVNDIETASNFLFETLDEMRRVKPAAASAPADA